MLFLISYINKTICYWFGHRFSAIERFGFPGLLCHRCDFMTFGGKTQLIVRKL